MGILSGLIGGVGGLTGLFSGRERGRRIERGGRKADAALTEGRDFAINESGLGGFRDRGGAADQTFFDALGLGEPAAADAAFSRFQDNTGFRSQLKAGQEAIGAGAAAAGKFNSGDTGKALVGFGQDLGRRSFNDFLGQLSGQAGRGLSAAGGIANAATGTGAQRAQNFVNTENASANARKGGQDDFFEGIGSIFGGFL